MYLWRFHVAVKFFELFPISEYHIMVSDFGRNKRAERTDKFWGSYIGCWVNLFNKFKFQLINIYTRK